MAAARQRMIAKRFGGQPPGRTGGKTSVRRKKKTVHKSSNSDDKKLGATLKKLNTTNIPGIEEVNLFTNDGKVIHFQNPKVQTSIQSNTYVIMGPNETKPLTEMIPSILTQLGPDHMEQMKQQYLGSAGGATPGTDDDDEDDMPELVENFEVSQD